jgi:hypothetical protein
MEPRGDSMVTKYQAKTWASLIDHGKFVKSQFPFWIKIHIESANLYENSCKLMRASKWSRVGEKRTWHSPTHPQGVLEESLRSLWGLLEESWRSLWGVSEDSLRTPWGVWKWLRSLWGLLEDSWRSPWGVLKELLGSPWGVLGVPEESLRSPQELQGVFEEFSRILYNYVYYNLKIFLQQRIELAASWGKITWYACN